MEEHAIRSVGSVAFLATSFEIRIEAPYRKALRGLDEFSHLLALLVASDSRLRLRVLRLDGFDAKRGVLVCRRDALVESETEGGLSDGATSTSFPRAGSLIDLKPYLPCEDFVGERVQRVDVPGTLPVRRAADGSYSVGEAGVVRTNEGRPYLEFANDVPVAEGAVVRVVWWFSRFEEAKFRRVTTCHPPYETKREIGVFASRSPVRPNPIALTIVKVLRVDRTLRRAYVSAIECFDGTPFVGVLPYDAACEAMVGARTGEWAKDWPRCVDFSLPADGSAETDRIARELDAARLPLPELPDGVGTESGLPTVRPTGIVVHGARMNNLKAVDVVVPYGKVTAIVGVSGSGKSSLAMDTVAAECQRRMACFGERTDEIEPVAVDEMTGCLPVIRIAQRRLRPNVRSTVGTFSGAATHLRVLYAKLGVRHRTDETSVSFSLTPSTFSVCDPDARCPACDGCGVRLVADPDLVIAYPEKSLLEGASPLLGRLDSFLRKPNANWTKGQVVALAQKMKVDLSRPWTDLPEKFRALILNGDPSLTVTFAFAGGSSGRGCETSRPLEGLLPIVERLRAEGGAASTAGKFLTKTACPVCRGERLASEGRLVTLCGVRYPIASAMTFEEIERFLVAVERAVGLGAGIRDHVQSLRSLCQVARRLGISEIELSRPTSDLSGGEAQRLKLLAAFCNHISGILYVFDEPSQNLGRNEYGRVSDLFRALTGEGNTILMVEHNPEMISIADHVIEIGPGAGVCGGSVVASGTYGELASDRSTLLGAYAGNPPLPGWRKLTGDRGVFAVRNVRCHTLNGVNVDFPKGAFTCITGCSGSGKSSLVYGGVLPQARATNDFDEVVVVESRIVCTTPRSTIATYTGVMEDLRRTFGTDGATVRGLLRLSVEEAATRLEGGCPRAAATCRQLMRNGLGYLKLEQQTATLSGGEAARLKIVCSLGVKRLKNALYLLDEPTCGLHFTDIDRLLSLLFELRDAGNTIIAIEHNVRFLSAADRIVVMGPGSGRHGGRIVGEGSPT